MTKVRVRKPFLRNQSGASDSVRSRRGQLTAESETITYEEEQGWERKTTKAKKAVVNKLPTKVAHPSNLAVRTATGRSVYSSDGCLRAGFGSYNSALSVFVERYLRK